ncbi:GTPase HflX [Armatimonas sp.]|uniref:GTPase HflX n=1 Tax=Armatimonas sp. TaxID=1872638 RepID=UPI00286D1A09|nr:GTPase HflX [Armatimonas sp.]
MINKLQANVTDESAILVALETDESQDSIEVRLDELTELASTADIEVLERFSQRKHKADSAFLIGHGKADELYTLVAELEPTVVIFDNELSPTQQRNLEVTLKTRVMDRTQLILDIFAQRARTREGKLQVQLAQLTYSLPRVGLLYTKFERQQGGIGVRGGGGESKVALDKRKIREDIADLTRELEEVKKTRRQQRSARRKLPFPSAALVGYTSAGKSTLLNLLSGSEVLADRMLFSTLDPTTRRVILPDGRGILLTDTVGFIRSLPHDLVAAFRATLEETIEADFLIHVVDISSPEADRHRDTVLETLEALGAHNKLILTVFNKSDLVENIEELQDLVSKTPNSCYISAAKAEGLNSLMERVSETIKNLVDTMLVAIPYSRSELVAQCHEFGVVHSVDYGPEHILVRADVARSLAGKLEEFQIV